MSIRCISWLTLGLAAAFLVVAVVMASVSAWTERVVHSFGVAPSQHETRLAA